MSHGPTNTAQWEERVGLGSGYRVDKLSGVRVLVIGSGGREHALVAALRRDKAVSQVITAPGNAGIAREAPVRPVDPSSADEVVALARQVAADLVVIGPEVPLVLGVADAIRAAGIPCFGPSAAAARIEGSKAFAKDVMAAAGVRTAQSAIVDNPAELDTALESFGPTWVVKDDGLAAGKGVVVTTDRAVARGHAAGLLEQGHPVLLESFLDGPEVSLFCLVDGETVRPLVPAQDHKRVGDEDTGPNTGGMGAYAPVPWLAPGMVKTIVSEIVTPVAAEMVRRGCPFSGLLYAGLALGDNGPAVVEFNCRFGDPEAQVVLALLASPLGQLLHATATGHLAEAPAVTWHPGAAVAVVLAAENYPGHPRLGDPITGLQAPPTATATVFHAGTTTREDGTLVSAGGRVLNVVGTGPDLVAARAAAYQRLSDITLPGSHYRTDIALSATRAPLSS